MNIEYISVSRFGVWDLCKQQYKYKYHLKIPSPVAEPFYFVYGKIIHKIAEIYVEQNGEKLLSECALDVLEGRVPIENGRVDKNEPDVFAPELPPDYRRRLPEHLRSVKKITDEIGMGGDLEYQFNYDMDPPNGRFIKGFIDRLIKKGDYYFILDYKTTKKGKWRKDSQSITHDLQLRAYAKVVQKFFNVPAENIRCALYYLEGGNLVGAKYSQAALDAAEQELIEAHRQISEAAPDQVQGTVGDHCNRCDYRSMCPYFNMV
jgi:RecB family exonuclease